MGLLDGIDRLHASLDYHLARHNVLTSNLALVDTPGARAMDLARPGDPSFGDSLATEMTLTDPKHLSAAGSVGNNYQVIVDPTTSAGLDGNAISLDREAVKIATNQIRYDTITQLTAGELSSLEWAVTDGKTA
jgi:flagellar basal-body rod protein FlgB